MTIYVLQGENVCRVLLRVGEIRSSVPPTVHMMCLTATTGLESRSKLQHPKVSTVLPQG